MPRPSPRRTFRPALEPLDGRIVPATLVAEHLYGGTDNEAGTGVAVADTGAGFSVYLSGTVDKNDTDGVVAKYTIPYGLTGGSRDWATAWPGKAGYDGLESVAANAAGVYAGGTSYSQTKDAVGDKEAKGVVVGFPAAGGAATWARQAPAAPGAFSYGGYEHLTDVTAATEDGKTVLYATGGAQSGFSNGSRFWVAKVEAGGEVVWKRTDSSVVSNSDGYDVAAAGGFVYAAGLTNDDGTRRGYVKKYDAAGNLAWARSSAAGMFTAVAVDPAAGALYAAGRTNGTGSDFLVEKWDLGGTVLWSRTFDRGGTPDPVRGFSDAVNALALGGGRVYAVGSTRGGTAGGSDGIVLAIDAATGNLVGHTLWGGAQDDALTDVAATPGALHVAGTTRSAGAGGSDLAYLVFGAPVVGTVRSTFNTGAEGWRVAGDAQNGTRLPTYKPTGGNPGGHISAVDDVEGNTWYWVAPDKFLGDAWGNYGKYLGFDLKQSSTTSQYNQDDVVLAGGGHVLVADTPVNPRTTWTRYSVRLDPSAGWRHRATGVAATEAEIKAVLADLAALRIRGEYRTGADTGGLDNVVFGGDAPGLTVTDSAVTEGKTRSVLGKLTVTLDAISSQPVRVDYATADGTAAAADGDYLAAAGTLHFLPGETTKTLRPVVYGDPHVERDEAFAVRLDGPTNARLVDPVGRVTIRTDDGPVDETRVNGTTADGQNTPRVAVDAAGKSVVVWASFAQDGDGWGVYARRVDFLGRPIGGEFRVNQSTAGRQNAPRVAMDAAGNFVVVWEGKGVGDDVGVFARRYNAAGSPLGDEFRVNAETGNGQGDSSVAMNLGGDFVVTWSSLNQDGGGWGVYGQRFDRTGARVGGEFRANTTTAGHQDGGRVAINSRGEFVVAWVDYSAGDGDGSGVFAQRYDAAGDRVRGQFRVNTTTAGNQGYGGFAVGLDDYGRMAAVYTSPDGDGTGVYLQRFAATGLRLGREVRVHVGVAGTQGQPALAVGPAGDFTVAWTTGNADLSRGEVHIQRYSAGGLKVGPETRLNATIAGLQDGPALALTPAGQGVAVWQGFGPGDDDGVFLQRFGI